MIDNELLLFDRIEAIKSINQKHDLENNAYLSFSGGKDSTILHYLLDIALPNNNIPRVFIDTGIEYQMIKEFALKMAEIDKRFVIIKSLTPIKPMLEKYGYPFKSKEHSLRVYQFNRGTNDKYIKKYLTGFDHNGKPTTFICPKILKYQFEVSGKYNYSNLCCYKLKKEPAHKYEKSSGRKIVITGMRNEEGGNRAKLGCIITSTKGKLLKFHPLIKVNEEWENWFIEKQGIKLAALYYPPFNFKRTGCKGCPFAIKLQEELDTLEKLLPIEKKQCEAIWKPIYEEYRRIGYRLRKEDEDD